MHAVFFASKRVHLQVVWRLTLPLLERSGCGLTPARFDLMRIVDMRREHGVPQGMLPWLLAVSAPTVSRMVKSLVALGFLRRTYGVSDRRCRTVHITPEGIVAVERALAATVGAREDERAVARCATGDTTRRRRGSASETAAMIHEAEGQVDALARTLARMRAALSDHAPFVHPWRATFTRPPTFHALVDGVVRFGDQWPIDPDWDPAPLLEALRRS